MKNILLVDDAQFVRYTMRIILEGKGFNIIGEAENGQVAVKLYQELQPDIVFMDITMPEMDGVQAVKEIIKKDSNAKIIMLSAMGKEDTVREAIMSGAKGFIVKPFKEETILKVIEKL